MALESHHIGRLSEGLKGHEARISELRKQATALEEEIAVHDWIIRLGRDEEILRILSDLTADPESADSMQGHELEIAEKHHIQIPPGATVRVTREGKSVTVFLDAMGAKIPFTLEWNSERGFSSGPHQRTF